MKVILLTTYHSIPANIAVKAFLQNTLRTKHDIQVVGIVACSMFSPERSLWGHVKKFLARCGWEFAVRLFIVNFCQCLAVRLAKFFVADRKREIFEVEELAQKYRIPFLFTEKINSEEVLRFVGTKQPDFVISCLLYHKVEAPLLRIAKGGAINFHPALFQDHRGTFSGFWTLLRRRKRSGATVHFMTEKVDAGEVILQRHFRVFPSDTLYCVERKSAHLGGNLLVKALVKLKKQKAKRLWLQRVSYFLSMPNREQVARFCKSGKQLIKWKDFFRV